MTEKLNNVEQTNFENGPERTTGANPEVISPSNESLTSPITKTDPTGLNLSENNNQNNNQEEVFSPSDKGGIEKEEANNSGRIWYEIYRKKQEGSTEIPL